MLFTINFFFFSFWFFNFIIGICFQHGRYSQKRFGFHFDIMLQQWYQLTHLFQFIFSQQFFLFLFDGQSLSNFFFSNTYFSSFIWKRKKNKQWNIWHTGLFQLNGLRFRLQRHKYSTSKALHSYNLLDALHEKKIFILLLILRFFSLCIACTLFSFFSYKIATSFVCSLTTWWFHAIFVYATIAKKKLSFDNCKKQAMNHCLFISIY